MNWFKARRGLGKLLLLLALGTPLAQASETKTAIPPDKTFAWSLTFDNRWLNWRLPNFEGMEIRTASQQFGIGAGQVYDRWFWLGQLQYLSGPYRIPEFSYHEVDHFGTAWSAKLGVSVDGALLRRASPGQIAFGFILGVQQSDLTGRSLDGHLQSPPSGRQPYYDPGRRQVVMKTSWIALQGGLFFGLAKEPRPLDFQSENLQTRLEGVLFQVFYEVPVYSRYQLSYQEMPMRLNWQQKIEATHVSSSGKIAGGVFGVGFLVWIAP